MNLQLQQIKVCTDLVLPDFTFLSMNIDLPECSKITAVRLKMIAGRWFTFLKAICIKVHFVCLFVLGLVCLVFKKTPHSYWYFLHVAMNRGFNIYFLKNINKKPATNPQRNNRQPSSVRPWQAWAECSLSNWFKPTVCGFAVPFIWYWNGDTAF